MSSPSRLFEKRHLFYDQPRPFCSSLLQVVKLFDGLFLGNPHAWRETEFLTNNKIALVVNLAPMDVQPHPPKYVATINYDFGGKSGQEQVLALPGLLETIAAMENCVRVRQQGVVVLSKGIDSSVVAFAALYLMIKFRWTSQEALSFLTQRCPETQLLPDHQRILENFASHRERHKLSQAFQTDQTGHEKELLSNTIVNSQTINMPDFHGLTFHRDPENQQQCAVEHCRRVRFKLEVEVINKGSREGNESKLASVQTKLRQFIREKCALMKEGSNYSHKTASASNQDEADKIVFIKSKDILCRVPRKRATSKTQQSTLLIKKSNTSKEREQRSKDKPGSALQQEFLIEFKEEDSFFKKSQPLKMFIPLELQLRGDEDGQQSTRRNYVLHNNKRYRMAKKCYTEESISSTYLQPDIPRNKKQDHPRLHTHGNSQQAAAMFKISKSSKTSSKKIRINTAAMSTLGKQSQKCMRVQTEEEQEVVPRVINFNLNVQIDNINVLRQKSLREDKKSRILGRPHQGKKFSTALSSIVHDA